MKRTPVPRLAALTALVLVAMSAAQSSAARPLPISEVAAKASLTRIQHPGGLTDLATYARFRGGPTGVYDGVYLRRGQAGVIPRELSRITQPGGVYDVAG